MSDKLTYAQQIFLQRLTNDRVLSDTEANALFVEIQQFCQETADSQSQLDTRCDHSLEACIGAINACIVPLLQLEISTVVIREENENVRYHGLVNKVADDAAKLYASPGHNIHEVAFFRTILEKFVEAGHDAGESNAIGCPGVLRATEIINLRSELKGAHSGKLSALQAEEAMKTFCSEFWIAPSGRNEFKLGSR